MNKLFKNKTHKHLISLILFSFALTSCDLLSGLNSPYKKKSSSGKEEISEPTSSSKSSKSETHVHTYDEYWSSDDEYHWKAATCGHDVVKDKQKHNLVTTNLDEPSYDHPYRVETSCTVCGYTKVETVQPLEHHYANYWSYDENQHWKQCLDEGYEDLAFDAAEHDLYIKSRTSATFEQGEIVTYACRTCGYTRQETISDPLEHSYSNEWTSDRTGHWYQCIDAGYSNLKRDFEPHTLVNEVVEPTFEQQGYTVHTCSVCSYSYTDTFTPQLTHNYSSDYSHDANQHWRQCTDEGYLNLKTDVQNHNYDRVLESGEVWSKVRCSVCQDTIIRDTDQIIYEGDIEYDDTGNIRVFNLRNSNCCAIEIVDKSLLGDQIVIPNIINGKVVTHIMAHAFSDTSIKSITLPSTLYMIGTGAFERCYNLTNIELPNLLEKICDQAFSNCNSLKNIVVPESVTSMGNSAFYGCVGLESATINGNLTTINRQMFLGCEALRTVDLPDTVTSIEPYAFHGCYSLESITIPPLVSRIQTSLFNDCQSLRSINISSRISRIADDAFFGCISLEEYVVDPDNTVYCSVDGVLYNKAQTELLSCPPAKTGVMTIPNNITKIKQYGFLWCSHLTEIVFPNNLVTIGPWAFQECSHVTSFNIPASATDVDYTAFVECDGLTEINVDKNNPNFSSVDGVLYNKSKDKLVVYPRSKLYENEFTVPEYVTEIGTYAFDGCFLTNVNLPNSLTKIGYAAFQESKKLKSIVIPNTITSLEDSLFCNCNSLESIALPNNITTIPYQMFLNTSIKKLVIPDSVTTIGSSIFGNSPLESIVLPANLRKIEAYAFNDCRYLQNIFYKGTSDNWSHITIGSEQCENFNDTIRYYSEVEATNCWHYVDDVPTLW